MLEFSVYKRRPSAKERRSYLLSVMKYLKLFISTAELWEVPQINGYYNDPDIGVCSYEALNRDLMWLEEEAYIEGEHHGAPYPTTWRVRVETTFIAR